MFNIIALIMDGYQLLAIIGEEPGPDFGFELVCVLRIPAIHGAKTTKIRPPWYILLDYFTKCPARIYPIRRTFEIVLQDWQISRTLHFF